MDWGPGCFQPLHHGVDHGGPVGQPVAGVTRASGGDGLAAMVSLGCLRVCGWWGCGMVGYGFAQLLFNFSLPAWGGATSGECLRPGSPYCACPARGSLCRLIPVSDRLAAPCRVVSLLHVDELPFVLPLSVRGMRGMLESLSLYTVSVYYTMDCHCHCQFSML